MALNRLVGVPQMFRWFERLRENEPVGTTTSFDGNGSAPPPLDSTSVAREKFGAANSELLNVSEVAAMLGITSPTVRTYIQDGFLKATRLPGGRNWVVKKGDLERMLSENESATAPTTEERAEHILRKLNAVGTRRRPGSPRAG